MKKADALTPQPVPAGVISTRSIPNELTSNAAPAGKLIIFPHMEFCGVLYTKENNMARNAAPGTLIYFFSHFCCPTEFYVGIKLKNV